MSLLDSTPQMVLIIDDDPNNLKVVVEYIRAYNYEILIARDGERGLERARRGQPDLILLDVTMPGIDGFETIRRLAADPTTRDIPVIFMSGRTELEDKIRGFELGSVDYITKPVEKRELLARVQAHLKISQQQAQLASYAELLEQNISTKAQLAEHKQAQQDLLQREITHLKDLLQTQGKQIRTLTREWLQQQHQVADQSKNGPCAPHTAEPDGVLARREHPAMELLAAHLRLAHGLLSAKREDDEVTAAQRHVTIALEVASNIQLEVASSPEPLGADPFQALSKREREIVVMMVSGNSNKEIAFELGLASSTVSTHRQRIMRRLDLDDFPALIKLALKHGVVS